MTAFTPTDIPSSVNTLEKLIVWASTIMNDLYTDTTAIESTGNAERVCQSAPFLITAVTPPTWRVVSRTSIPLQPTWRRQQKIWQFAIDIGSASIPTEFKS
jgi:hypothetical protein